MTLRGQIEVKHISEGCNLETLVDRAMVTIKVEEEVIDALSNGAVGFDLEWPGEVKIEVKHIS